VRAEPGGRYGVLGRREFTGERELLRPIRQHAQEPVPVATTSALAETRIPRGAEAAHPAVVVGVEQPDGDPRLHVLALVPRAAAVPLTIHEGDLAVDLVVLPLAVDPRAEVGRGGVAVAVERHRSLHAVVPQ